MKQRDLKKSLFSQSSDLREEKNIRSSTVPKAFRLIIKIG
jgi:hypothetical protein